MRLVIGPRHREGTSFGHSGTSEVAQTLLLGDGLILAFHFERREGGRSESADKCLHTVVAETWKMHLGNN